MLPSDRHHVVFQFRLPPVLLLHAQPGLWPRAPRGASVDVGEDGAVVVTSYDHLETYARDQVLRVACAYLRACVRNAPPVTIRATLSAPSCRQRPVGYAISLGAKVSIAETNARPVVIGAGEAMLNQAAG